MTIAAIRYNNPGNVSLPIKGWTGGGSVVGISGQSGYASFPDMATGSRALDTRLQTYVGGRGLNTIGQLNTVYAEDANWASGVSRASGIGVNDIIDPNNASQMAQLKSGIIRQETGMSPSALGIDALTPSDGSATPEPLEYIPITDPNQPAPVGDYDLNAGGVYDWTGDPTRDPAYLAAQQNAAATKAAGSVKAGQEGKPTDVPTAIVTAGNQQAQTVAAATKGLAQTLAQTAQSVQAQQTANQGTLQGFFASRLLQIAVFVLAAIFVLIGLYMFTTKQTIQMVSPA